MRRYIYSVWFLDHDAHSDEQDCEWVACIGIDAASKEDAQGWGDTLARDRVRRRLKDSFLHSSVELEDEVTGVTDWSSLPRISAGEAVTDDVIGW